MDERQQQAAQFVKRILGTVLLLVAILILVMAASYTVPPGHRGVVVRLGRVESDFAPEGFGLKMPFVTSVEPISIRQETQTVRAECYSSDMQQIGAELKVLYRVPEGSVVRIFRDYAGDPFESLIAPRIVEALKEVTALQSAEQLVKKREEIKTKVHALAKIKIGGMIILEDTVVQNVTLSKQLEHAIEAKMVQEQEAAKAKFVQQKAEIEANTSIIRAKGEAEAIRIRGEALRANPNLVQLQIVEKWNGVAPLVIGGGSGSNIILPVQNQPGR